MQSSLVDWVNTAPIWLIALVALAISFSGGVLGHLLRTRIDKTEKPETAAVETKSGGNQEGYIVSGILGLLSILLGFTLAIALDRFEARRLLVAEEATSLGSAYLQSQLLGEPHRTRLTQLISAYTTNRIALATAPRADVATLLADNDQLISSLWAATAAAYDSISNLDFSSTFVQTVSDVIRLDTTRKTSRLARVPLAIFFVLLTYIFTAAAALGYVLIGARSKFQGAFLITLLTLSLMLIVDLDRPTMGGLRESQRPMEMIAKSMKTWPSQSFDRWRTPALRASPSP